MFSMSNNAQLRPLGPGSAPDDQAQQNIQVRQDPSALLAVIGDFSSSPINDILNYGALVLPPVLPDDPTLFKG